jgi:hypothetical protein
MDSSLGNVKTRAKEMDYERIEEPIDKFCKDLSSFLQICDREFVCGVDIRWSQPRNLRNLLISPDYLDANLYSTQNGV